MSGTRKMACDDLSDSNFPAMLAKVVNGRCCIPGCDRPTQLIFHLRDDKPHLCEFHIDDGEETHFGEYANNHNGHFSKWSCCDSGWKKSKCSQLRILFNTHSEIPVTQEQIAFAKVKEEEARIRAEENERLERIINAGYEPSYDR